MILIIDSNSNLLLCLEACGIIKRGGKTTWMEGRKRRRMLRRLSAGGLVRWSWPWKTLGTSVSLYPLCLFYFCPLVLLYASLCWLCWLECCCWSFEVDRLFSVWSPTLWWTQSSEGFMFGFFGNSVPWYCLECWIGSETSPNDVKLRARGVLFISGLLQYVVLGLTLFLVFGLVYWQAWRGFEVLQVSTWV